MVASSAYSLTHRRALACSASRLVPRPPDLTRWVRREGGYVHPNLRIADSSCGLGVVSADDIPPFSELIVLPTHLPLRFRRPPDPPRGDGAHSLLAHLASRVPGNGFPFSVFSSQCELQTCIEIILLFFSCMIVPTEFSQIEQLGCLLIRILVSEWLLCCLIPSIEYPSLLFGYMLGLVCSQLSRLSLYAVTCYFTEIKAIVSFSLRSKIDHVGEHVTEELWAMRLGLRLLHERATVGSFWWPYISNLPEAFTVPVFFPGDDIKSLQYAPLLHQVNKRCRFLLEFEKEVKNMIDDAASEDHPFGDQDVNASSLGWAMSAVSSRAFCLHGEILSDGKHSEVPMLLPLIDMCNHSFNPNARIVQEQDTSSRNMSVKVVAETHINRDTAVTLNYGCLSNDLLLLDYGFVIPSNPYDQIELKYDETLLDAASMAAGVSSPSFSSPAKWQQEILSRLNLQGDGALLKVTLGGPELVDGRLLAALRVLLTTDSEKVKMLDLNALKSLGEEAPLGSSVEAAAVRTVIALCIIALEHFPTKIMEDESILKAGASHSTELAVQFRMQKKLMIIDVMRKLTQRVKMLLKEKSAA